MPPERPWKSQFLSADNTHAAGMPLIREEMPLISILTAKSINISHRTPNRQNRKLWASPFAISIISIISPKILWGHFFFDGHIIILLYIYLYKYILFYNVFLLFLFQDQNIPPTFQVKLLKLLKSHTSRKQTSNRLRYFQN